MFGLNFSVSRIYFAPNICPYIIGINFYFCTKIGYFWTRVPTLKCQISEGGSDKGAKF